MVDFQGDSGGPLLVKNETLYQVVGIVSWGEGNVLSLQLWLYNQMASNGIFSRFNFCFRLGCAEANYPGVYTRVNRYRTWVKSNTKDACYCGDQNWKHLLFILFVYLRWAEHLYLFKNEILIESTNIYSLMKNEIEMAKARIHFALAPCSINKLWSNLWNNRIWFWFFFYMCSDASISVSGHTQKQPHTSTKCIWILFRTGSICTTDKPPLNGWCVCSADICESLHTCMDVCVSCACIGLFQMKKPLYEALSNKKSMLSISNIKF